MLLALVHADKRLLRDELHSLVGACAPLLDRGVRLGGGGRVRRRLVNLDVGLGPILIEELVGYLVGLLGVVGLDVDVDRRLLIEHGGLVARVLDVVVDNFKRFCSIHCVGILRLLALDQRILMFVHPTALQVSVVLVFLEKCLEQSLLLLFEISMLRQLLLVKVVLVQLRFRLRLHDARSRRARRIDQRLI